MADRSTILARLRSAVASAVGRLNKPRAYRARDGFARGYKVVGGVGLILPNRFRSPSEFPEFDGLEEAFLRRLDLRRQTVYDIGAFQGILTVFFAAQVGEDGRVVAFEPHPDSYARVKENLSLNDFSNVTVRNVGLGRAPGELRLAGLPGGSGQATADEGIADSLASQDVELEIKTVPVNSLDSEIEELSLPKPDFVKIDVEGLELDVLNGMLNTLEQRQPALFVEIHGGDLAAKRANAEQVITFLDEHGYASHHVESDQPVDASDSEIAIRGHIYCRPRP